MQINFLNYLSCTAEGRGQPVLHGTGPWLVTFHVPVLHGASSPSSSLLSAPMGLTHRQCGSERARRYWGCVPSEAEERGGPSGRLGLTPCPQPSHHSTSQPSVCSREPPDPTHKVHTVLSQPVKALEEEKESEECHKAGAKVIPKNSEGQTSLSDSVPGTFQKMLQVGQGMMWNSDILLAQLPAPHLWSHEHLTSISAALSCPKNTLPITLPKRKTRTKAWMYRT